MSAYISLWSKRIMESPEVAKRGFRNRSQMISGAKEHYCSLVLSRPFGMTGEQFDKENPEIAEFGKWIKNL